jgi:hypothetical protein
MRLEQRWGWRRLATVLAVGLVLVLGAAGCGRSSDGGNEVASLGGERQGGGDGAAANGAADKDPQEAALEYARCMREHGIDMPDPKVDEDGRLEMRIGSSGRKPDPKKLEEAEKACGHLLRAGGEKGRGRLDPEAEEAMLKFARCMREHGIDMPDPGEGGLVVRNEPGKGSGPDPESSKFRQAEEACKHLLPKRDRGPAESGGGS